MSRLVVQETRLGRTINQLRRSTDDPEVQKKAKKLLKSWQKFIKPSTNSAAPGAASAQAADAAAAATNSVASAAAGSSSNAASATASSPVKSSSSVNAAPRHSPAVNGARLRPHHALLTQPSPSSSPSSSPALKLRPLPSPSQEALPSILKRSSASSKEDLRSSSAAADEICDTNKNKTDSFDSSPSKYGAIIKDSSSSSSSRSSPKAKKRVRFDCVERIDSPVASRTKLVTSPPRQAASTPDGGTPDTAQPRQAETKTIPGREDGNGQFYEFVSVLCFM